MGSQREIFNLIFIVHCPESALFVTKQVGVCKSKTHNLSRVNMVFTFQAATGEKI